MFDCRAQLSIYSLCRCLVKYTALVFTQPLLFRQIYFTMENPSAERADNHNIGAIAVPSQGTM